MAKTTESSMVRWSPLQLGKILAYHDSPTPKVPVHFYGPPSSVKSEGTEAYFYKRAAELK